MADCHKTNGACFPVDGIDDAKPADAKLPEPGEFAQERLAEDILEGQAPPARASTFLVLPNLQPEPWNLKPVPCPSPLATCDSPLATDYLPLTTY